MKILSIVCNIVLLGLPCLGLLTNGTPENVVFTFLLFLVPILNIVLMFGSSVKYVRMTFNFKFKTSQEQREIDNRSSI
jgi:hypothetical protein